MVRTGRRSVNWGKQSDGVEHHSVLKTLDGDVVFRLPSNGIVAD